jgi:chemotaxis protein CheD
VTENLHVVFIGDMAASNTPDDVLVAYGLGSCVAVCLYDHVARVGGMLHALLPTVFNENKGESKPTKFVDRGVPLLVDALLKLGGERTRLIARVCGGAQLLSTRSLQIEPNINGSLAIGKLNVAAAEAALRSNGLRIGAQATGGRIGRTVKLYLADGRVTVKTLKHDERILE